MEEAEIITRVTKPTRWVSPMVVATKHDGSVRLCLDPFDLNKLIQRQHHAIPSSKELYGRICKVRWFVDLIASTGFFQIQLTEEATYK